MAMWQRLTATVIFLALIPQHSGRAITKESVILQDDAAPTTFVLEVLKTIPHIGKPFTQGLEMHSDGHHLVESSGSFPPGVQSYIRIIDPANGQTVSTLTDGLKDRFIEGITRRPNGNWVASTYDEHRALVYDKDFKLLADRDYPNMGWGFTLTPDGKSFLATNGSDILMTQDPATYKVTDEKVITCLGKRVKGLNELELVDNFAGLGPTLLGNIYLSRLVLAINPATGKCMGTFSLDNLCPVAMGPQGEASGFHAANGLAYDKKTGNLWITGKNWDSMFEVKVHVDPQQMALGELGQHLMWSEAPAAAAAASLMELNSSGEASAVKVEHKRPTNILTRQQVLIKPHN